MLAAERLEIDVAIAKLIRKCRNDDEAGVLEDDAKQVDGVGTGVEYGYYSRSSHRSFVSLCHAVRRAVANLRQIGT